MDLKVFAYLLRNYKILFNFTRLYKTTINTDNSTNKKLYYKIQIVKNIKLYLFFT